MNSDLLHRNLNSLLSSHAISGAASGFIIGIALQPLEIIKVCLIVNPTNLALLNNANFAQSFMLSTRLIYQLEGLKGFWRGLTPALLRIGVANSVYFHFLNKFNKTAAIFDLNKRANDFVSSSAARVVSTLVVNPFTMLKTRMELPGKQFNYRGVGDALTKIYNKEGPKAFLKGAGACMLRDVPFAGIYYTALNFMREKLAFTGIQTSANTMVSGMLAGLVATAATHPFEVIRTHIQVESTGVKSKQGIFGGLYEIQQKQGVAGLFRGLQARLMRKPLSNALTFTLFEIFQKNNKKEMRML